MSSTEEERKVRRTSPFADDVAEEGALEIDEGVVERSVSLDPPFVPSFDVAEREGAECIRRALEHFNREVICGMEPVLGADDNGQDSFVTWLAAVKEMRAQSLRVSLSQMLSCVQTDSQKLFWRVLSVHCHCVSLHSSFSLAFPIGVI